MLRVKSVVILKANPGILKLGGGIKMWMWLCIERRSYLGSGDRVGMRKIGRNSARQKKDAKRVVYMAMDQKAWEAVEKVDSSRDGRELFRIAKQRAGEKSDIVGVSCLKDKSGAVKVSMDDRKKIWKEHMEKLMNVENEWSDSIDASKVERAVRRIEIEEVGCAMNRMKIGKASGPSEVALEMFKAGGDKCLKSLANIFNDILFKNKLPEEWMLSLLVPIFKGKGDPPKSKLL